MIVRKGLLYVVLSHVLRSIDRQAPIPALHHVRLDADGDALRVQATDLTSHITATVPCQGRFSACLPARTLTEFVKPESTADGQTVVELLPESGSKVTVAVEAAITTMTSLPASDFPLRPGDNVPITDWRPIGKWSSPDFAEAIAWALMAVGTDETRKHLTGLYFAAKEIIGLDGHRLHAVTLEGLTGEPLLLPAKCIAALLRILPKMGELTAVRGQQAIRFRCATGSVQWEIEAGAMAEKFPPFDQVIPAEGSETFRMDVERAALLRAVARMPRVKQGRARGVRLVVNGAIRLERDGDDGMASCTVPVLSTNHLGADSVLGINGTYLADALSCDVPIAIARFGGPLDPIRLDLGPNKLAVLMPMRL